MSTRHDEVLDTLIVHFNGRASALALGQAMGLPQASVRMYLTDLARQGWVLREHGRARKRYIYVATQRGRLAYDSKEELA